MKRSIPLLVTSSFLLLAACQDKSADSSTKPTEKVEADATPGVAFRLAPSSVAQIVAQSDSVEVTATYEDGTTRRIKAPLSGALDALTGAVALPDLPIRDCALEVVFPSRDGKTRLRMTVVFEIELLDSPEDSLDGGKDPVDVDPLDTATTLDLAPLQDAWVGPEDNNAGLGGDLRLWEGGSMALLDFGDLTNRLRGRTIANARLVLHGWKGEISIGGGETSLALDVGTAPRGWIEGTGNWYWFDGQGRNGFATAYSLWPSFVAPERSTNPARATGINWNTATAQRRGFLRDTTLVPVLVDGPDGMFPTASMSSVLEIDATTLLKRIAAADANQSIAIRRATTSRAPKEAVAFFSKDVHPSVAPRLIVRFAD